MENRLWFAVRLQAAEVAETTKTAAPTVVVAEEPHRRPHSPTGSSMVTLDNIDRNGGIMGTVVTNPA
jgi:hypothetical protein